jgi:dTDP-4-amino-4,6-dideoxygalactose transaminase
MTTTISTIPVARPWMDEREAEAARRAILSGWVTQGPEVAAFEQEFAAAVGAIHACAVSSCTTALHLALLASGVTAGDEVVTVSHSFIATANAIRYCGATPVFVDIDLATFNMDPTLVEAALGPRTKAILCVHQLGLPCDLAAILAVAGRRGIPVIEDAACAAGSEILWDRRWERIGRPHGTVACFSFHPRKLLSTGDGGMLTTSDPDLDRRFRLLRQHGMSVADTVRHSATQVIHENYAIVGYNYRMTDIQAAIGLVQLGKLNAIVAQRRALAARYHELLADVPGTVPVRDPAHGTTNYQSFWVLLTDGFGAGRDEVLAALAAAGVSARRGIMAAHLEPAYAGAEHGALPNTERLTRDSLILPLHHALSADDQEYIVDVLRGIARA